MVRVGVTSRVRVSVKKQEEEGDEWDEKYVEYVEHMTDE